MPSNPRRKDPATEAALALSRPATCAITDAVKRWRTPPLASSALFPDALGANRQVAQLGRLFADPGHTRAFAKSLREIEGARRGQVAESMGAAFALDAARPLGGASIEKNLLAGVGKQIAGLQEAIRIPALRLAAAVERANHVARIAEQPLRVVAEMMTDFVEAQREVDERSDAFVRRHAWPVPTVLGVRRYARIVQLADAPKREVNAVMVELFRHGTTGYREARAVLDDSPHFASRKPLLRQVDRAQKRREWYLVINGLLPLVEGVLIDAMFPTGTRPKAIQPGVERLTEAEEDLAFGGGGIRAMETLLVGVGAGSAMFERYDPPPGVEPRTLNRNAVLHGTARRYGTEQNAVKLFLLLAVMAECFVLMEVAEERRRRREREEAAKQSQAAQALPRRAA